MAASTIHPPARLAVIGLGNMGHPMSACLAKAGFDVVGFDVSPAARERLERAGLKTASDCVAAVAGAAAVITILPDGNTVRGVVEELRAHLRPGIVLIDMSSSDPLGTR